MKWLPRIGWFPLDAEIVDDLELDPSYSYEGWGIEWFSYGVLLRVRPTGPRYY